MEVDDNKRGGGILLMWDRRVSRGTNWRKTISQLHKNLKLCKTHFAGPLLVFMPFTPRRKNLNSGRKWIQ